MFWKSRVGVLLLAGSAWAAQDGEGLRLAARYLDERQDFWMQWPQSERGKGVRCVSCHTGVPYLLARPVLRRALGESAATRYENQLLEGVRARVRAWDGPPYYPAKRAQSRGTESIFYALFLAADDAQRGNKNLSEATQAAFDHLWAEQIESGEERGSWEWLNFDLDPWEIPDAGYYGTALAAVAVGSAPGDYTSRADIQPRLAALREYLSLRRSNQSLHNRVILLWASAKLPSLLSPADQKAIVDETYRAQNADGGWSLRSLGRWKLRPAVTLGSESDAYATGLVAFALQQAGVRRSDAVLAKALAWLRNSQDTQSGSWSSQSMNKIRDPNSHAGKFMRDAATGYAVLALLANQ